MLILDFWFLVTELICYCFLFFPWFFLLSGLVPIYLFYFTSVYAMVTEVNLL